MIKMMVLVLRDFLLAMVFAFIAKYLIEWISPDEQVTPSHLSVMTASCLFMIRKYPISGVWAKGKGEANNG